MKKLLILGLVLAVTAPVFAQTHHLSARMIVGTGRDNQVFLADNTGTVYGQYPEAFGANTDSWGYRDGASDGTHVFFGWGAGLVQHDGDGSNPTLIVNGAAPGGVGTWRALAYDPTGNGGNGSIWTASFSSALIETDLAGNLLTNFPAAGWSLYGLSYDDTDGNLWGHDTGGAIIKIDTSTGGIIPGAGCATSLFPNLSAQGGLSGFSELGGNLAAVSQGTPDEWGIVDPINCVMVVGPVSIEGQTGSNGHLGVAVIPEPGALALLGLGALTLLRRRR